MNRVLTLILGKLLEIILGIIVASIGVSYLWIADYLEQYLDFWIAHAALITLLVLLIGGFLAHRFLKKKQHRRIALFTGIGLFIGIGSLITFNLLERTKPQPTFVVAVAQFDTSTNDDFKIQKIIINDLQKKYSTEITAIPVNKSIKTSEEAHKEGKKKRADLVLWGAYSVPEGISEEAEITVEILNNATASAKLSPQAKGEPISLSVKENHALTIRSNVTKNAAYVSLFVIGLAQYQKQQWDPAEQAFLKALHEIPQEKPFIDESNIYRYLGYISNKKHNNKQAIEYFTKAINKDPRDPVVWYNRGVAYYQSGNLEAAKHDYTQALKRDKRYADAYLNRGVIYSEQRHYHEAIKDYDAVLKINPKDDLAYYNRGGSKSNLEQYDQALADYTKAIKLNPTRPNNYTARATVYTKKGDTKQALTDYSEALKHQPTLHLQSVIYLLRGNIYYSLKQVDRAFDDYEHILTVEPNSKQFTIVGNQYYLRSMGEKDKKKKTAYQKKAAEYMNKAITLDPQNAQAYTNRGSYLLAEQKFDEAYADFDKAIKNDPTMGMAYTGRGFYYFFVAKDKEAALADYKKAIDLYNEQLLHTDTKEVKEATELLISAAEKFYTVISTASAVPAQSL